MPLSTFFNLPEEKRQKILECAIDEFAEHDYDSASVSKIVARAGIAKGSLYQYFADKSDLHSYLLELASQKKTEILAAANPPEPGMSLFGSLRWLFEEMGKFEILHPQLAKIGYRAIYGKSPLPETIITKARQSTTQYFTQLFEQGKQCGEIRSEIDSATAAFIFTAALTQLGDFLTTSGSVEAIKIAEQGSYPIQSPAVRNKFDQIIAILQFGMAK